MSRALALDEAMLVKYLNKLFAHLVIVGVTECNKLLSITASMALLFLPQSSHAAGKEIIAACDSPFVKELQNAPMIGQPRDDVWVLLVADQVKTINCSLGGMRELANYLERQWVNDVVGETIPVAKTISEAIRIESEIERSSPQNIEKLRQRAHTRSFSIEMRKEADPLPRGVPLPPSIDSLNRKIWPSRNMSPPGIAVPLAFTNITKRNIYWPSTDLFIRKPGTDKYAWFHCESEKRGIAPSERFIVFCSASATDWKSDDEGLALLEGLDNRDNWFLRPDDTRHNWPPYRMIMADLITQQSRQKAAEYIKGSTCKDRDSCLIENAQSPDYQVPAKSNLLPSPETVAGCYDLGKKGNFEKFRVSHISGNHYKIVFDKNDIPLALMPDGRYFPPISSQEYNNLSKKEKAEIEAERAKIEWHISFDIADKDKGKPEFEKTRMAGIYKLKHGVSDFMGAKAESSHFGIFPWFAAPIYKRTCPAGE